MRLRSIVALIVIAGCYSGRYRVRDPFIGQRVTFGDCIDLAVAQTVDAGARGTVLAYTFGNRCAHLAPIDLSAIHAVGRYSDGIHPMHAIDPQHELRPLRVELWSSATEQIAYESDDGATPTAICVDVGAVEPAAHVTAHWLCFGAWDLGLGAELQASRGIPTGPRPATIPWPASTTPEPEVVAMPAEAQDRIETVGRYLAARISDKHRLVKALHDYVVLRLHYDDDTRKNRDAGLPDALSQDAETVFAHRTGVCEGYARLLVALGDAAGVDIRYVGGQASGGDDNEPHTEGGHGHAWNAVNFDGEWALIDATWDHADHGTVSTEYLFMPPGQFARDHTPDDPQWALTAPPLGLDDFLREPWIGATP